jgi:hypothetical protein
VTLAWREHPEALDEYRAAANWYEDKRDGLGDAFMRDVDTAVESVLDPAIKWGLYGGRKTTPQIYTRSVAGFPFKVIYLELDDEILIVSYAHEKRRPGYWMHRLNE